MPYRRRHTRRDLVHLAVALAVLSGCAGACIALALTVRILACA